MNPTVGKPVFRWREMPVFPNREMKHAHFKAEDFSNLNDLLEEAMKFKPDITLRDIAIYCYDCYESSFVEFRFTYPELPEDFALRHAKYVKELDSYNKWLVDYHEEIKDYKQRQALKKNKEKQKKQKQLKQQIESLQKELNKLLDKLL